MSFFPASKTTFRRTRSWLLCLPLASLFAQPSPAVPNELSGGLHGYISMHIPNPPAGFGYGVSFYTGVWPLLDEPLAGFQIGLPGTWITPDNSTFDKACCPPGTLAAGWSERAPYFRDVFQTIEGGSGFWGSTQFGSRTAKYRINGVPSCYDYQVSSPGWGFGKPLALTGDKMGLAQLSNRLVIPPDGFTFRPETNGELLGSAWMALPLTPFKGYYGLTTMFLENEGLWLEGNKVAKGSTLGGAAFMNKGTLSKGLASGQGWKLVPLGGGYYGLTTLFLEKEDMWLECNKVAKGNTLGGAAFMAKGSGSGPATTGQMWKLVPFGDGYYGLTTAFLEQEGLWLEGNKVAKGSDLGGAAFMAKGPPHQPLASGQMWRLAGTPVGSTVPTGNQSWTFFLNTKTFRGPVAFWLPETWSRLSQSYRTIVGRGLDALPGRMAGGAMEVNTVPWIEQTEDGVTYTRAPRLNFPVDEDNKTVLMQDVKMYSRDALFASVMNWSSGGPAPSGRFDARAAWTPNGRANPIDNAFDQPQGYGDQRVRLPVMGISDVVQTEMLDAATCTFGLRWKRDAGVFPEYLKKEGSGLVVVSADEVPHDLTTRTFPPARNGSPYTSPRAAPWTEPGPRGGSTEITLTDGTVVTYSWYRFVDQPALQQLKLGKDEKARLQSLVEQIHANWTVDKEYLPAPSRGSLVELDSALLVTPPKGMERGYVPIATNQRKP